MRRFKVECDGCGKVLEITEEHIKNKKALVYHALQLDFRSFMKDPNTGQEEEVSNMARQTNNIYCNDCFLKLAEYMNKFIEDVRPNEEEILRVEKSDKIAREQSVEVDGLEALKQKIKEEE